MGSGTSRATEPRTDTGDEPVAPGTDGRTLLVASTLALVLAAMVSSTVHELAHAVAGLAQGLTPTVAPFQVEYSPEPTDDQGLVTAAAGPLFSLVLGLGLAVMTRSAGRGFVRLFWCWLAAISLMNFVGYLVIAPIAQVGDTGRVLALLGAPGWLFVLVCLVGVALQFALARHFAVQVKRYTRDLGEERVLAVAAWGLGTVAVLVLTGVQVVLLGAGGDVAVVVLIYAMAIAIFAPMQFTFSSRVRAPYEGLEIGPLAAPAAVTGVVALALVALAAVGGLRLG